MPARLSVFKLPALNILVIKQLADSQKFFISTKDSIVIDIPGIAFIIKYLVMNNLLHHKVLEGILDEFYSTRQ